MSEHMSNPEFSSKRKRYLKISRNGNDREHTDLQKRIFEVKETSKIDKSIT